MGPDDDPEAGAPAPADAAEAPSPSPEAVGGRRHRGLVTAVVVGLVASLVGGGVAVANDRKDKREAKERAARVAAAHRAEAAYVAAVHGLAVRVFDAVQPIQDVADAFAHPRPGLLGARDDVLRSGGAVRELKAVSLALARLQVPPAYAEAAPVVKQSLDALSSAVTGLEEATHQDADEDGYVQSFSLFEILLRAEIQWSTALVPLPVSSTWPVPDANRAKDNGRKAATAGGFILASDLICGKAEAAAEFEPYRTPAEAIRTLTRLSASVRSAVTQLKRVPHPPTQRAFQHQLQVGWSAALVNADDMAAVVAAAKQHDSTKVLRAFKRMKESLVGLEALGATYRSQGIRECGLFFSDGEPDTKGGSTTTA